MHWLTFTKLRCNAAEPPETAYIHEAAQWIAFGKIPEFYSSPEWGDEFDVRGEERAELDYLEAAIGIDYHGLPEEVPEVLTGIDLRTFKEAMESTQGVQVEEIERQRLNYEHLLSAIDRNEKSSEPPEARIQNILYNLARCEQEAELAKVIQSTFETILSYEERARAKLFYALSSGELDAFGWNRCAQEDKNSEIAQWEERGVKASLWRMSEIDWQRANLGKREDGSPFWVAVRVNFQELLTLFPEPDLPSEVLTVSRYGATITHTGIIMLLRREQTPLRHLSDLLLVEN